MSPFVGGTAPECERKVIVNADDLGSRHEVNAAIKYACRDGERKVIINADDLGSWHEVNAAIKYACRDGVLTSASIMMGGHAIDEAIDLARGCDALAVGLHVTLSDGRPVLPPERIPTLVGPDGAFWPTQAQLYHGLHRSHAMRQQMRAEIVAQFTALQATGLTCDHVNSHRNAHLHPMVAQTIFSVARTFGVRFARLPWEPPEVVQVAAAQAWDPSQPEPSALDCLRKARASVIRMLARWAGLAVPDRTFGMRWSGMMTPSRLAALLRVMPVGTNEIYVHPATTDDFPGAVPGFQYTSEFAALRDPSVRLAASRITLGSYTAMLCQSRRRVQ